MARKPATREAFVLFDVLYEMEPSVPIAAFQAKSLAGSMAMLPRAP
jgi:hypothetical protein